MFLKAGLEDSLAGVEYNDFYIMADDGQAEILRIPTGYDAQRCQEILDNTIRRYRNQGCKNVECLNEEEYYAKYSKASSKQFVRLAKTEAQIEAENVRREFFLRNSAWAAAQAAKYEKEQQARKKQLDLAAANKAKKEEEERMCQEQQAKKEAERKQRELAKQAAANQAGQQLQKQRDDILEDLRLKGIHLYDLEEKAKKYPNSIKLIQKVRAVIEEQRVLFNRSSKNLKGTLAESRLICAQIAIDIQNIECQIQEAEQSSYILATSSAIAEVDADVKKSLLDQNLGQKGDQEQEDKRSDSMFTKNYECFCLNSRPVVLGPAIECTICRLRRLEV